MTQVPAIPPVTEVSFTVPLVPPSVNSYVRHSRGRHYVTKEAQAFKEAIGICARGANCAAEEYQVEAHIYLGKGDRGDIDNFAKVILDGLVSAFVIKSDAAIRRLTLEKSRDWENPRTEITVKAKG